MSSDEVGYLSDAYKVSYREKWEMLRMQNHAVISSQSSKKVQLTDIMQFDWDKEAKVNSAPKESPEEARERIKKKFNLQ